MTAGRCVNGGGRIDVDLCGAGPRAAISRFGQSHEPHIACRLGLETSDLLGLSRISISVFWVETHLEGPVVEIGSNGNRRSKVGPVTAQEDLVLADISIRVPVLAREITETLHIEGALQVNGDGMRQRSRGPTISGA